MCSASVRMAIAREIAKTTRSASSSTTYLRHHKQHEQHHTHVHTCARCTAVGRVSAIRVDGSLSTASVVVRCTVLERRVAAAYSPSTYRAAYSERTGVLFKYSRVHLLCLCCLGNKLARH